MKHALSALVLSLVVSVPALAGAQSLESKGNAIFSADRLMGITATHASWEQGAFEAENDWTAFSFGWRGAPSVFDIPRVSFDYTVIDHLSVGGSLGFYSVDADDSPNYSGFLLSPRVGYILQFGRVVGMWPRGGFTYHSGEDQNNDDNNGLALTLECPFTFSPTEHFAFQVGPTFDVDMFGEAENRGPGNVDVDQNYRAFGINAGLFGWF